MTLFGLVPWISDNDPEKGNLNGRPYYMMSAEEIAMDLRKAGAVQEWLVPQYVKELLKSLAPCQALQVVPCNAFLSL